MRGARTLMWGGALLAVAMYRGMRVEAAPEATAEARMLRYERAVELAGGVGGQTCVELDAAVLEHAAGGVGRDMRLYAGAGAQTRETPFALTESAAAPADTETAAVSREVIRGKVEELDLAMPDRAYSDIELTVEGKDFLAVAKATGFANAGAEHRSGTRHGTGPGPVSGAGIGMGTVTLFDFSGQGLPRSTTLRLGESRFPVVHLRLEFLDGKGGPLRERVPVVTGASVPPSREEQVLYTTVAERPLMAAADGGLGASFAVGAHVPVERVRLKPEASSRTDFAGELRVTAQTQGTERSGPAERFEGEIGRVTRPDPGPRVPPIRFEQLSVGAAVGSNLRAPAEVDVRVTGGGEHALPLRAAVLEMRRRSLCFEAIAGTSYVLRYGASSEAMAAPAYGYARTFRMERTVRAARLGPERENAGSVGKVGARRRERRPELAWVGLIAVLALAGAVLLERLRRVR